MINDGDSYYFYDPNCRSGFRKYSPQELPKMSDDIFRANNVTFNTPSLFNLRTYDFAKEPSPIVYPDQESLLEKTTVIKEKMAFTKWQKDNIQLIHFLVIEGDIKSLKFYLENGNQFKETINLKNEVGKTPLDLAKDSNNIDIIQLLIEHGADLSLPSKDYRSLVNWAADKNHLDLVELLIKRKLVDYSAPNFNFASLFPAIRERPDLITMIESDSKLSLLQLGIKHRSTEIVTEALKSGVDICAKGNNDQSVLELALENDNGYFAIYLFLKQALIDNNQLLSDVILNTIKADPKIIKEVFRQAIEDGNLDACKHLLTINNQAYKPEDPGSDSSALLLAVKGRHGAIVDWLLSLNDKEMINQRDIDSITPLMSAVKKGYNDLVDTLLNHGADPNLSDNSNMSTLHYAALIGNVDGAARLLQQSGIDINAQDGGEDTPLLIAAQKKDKAMIEFLVNRGADLTITNENGKTALDYIIEERSKHEDTTEEYKLYQHLAQLLGEKTQKHTLEKIPVTSTSLGLFQHNKPIEFVSSEPEKPAPGVPGLRNNESSD